MQGLKTQETDKFLKFWAIVQGSAHRENSVFFLDCGEGREFETPDMEGEDLSGWLVPSNLADEFERTWKQNEIPDKWNSYITFAIWDNLEEGAR